MKITISSQEDDQFKSPTVSIEISDDSNIYDVMNSIRGMLIAYGFHNVSVVAGCQYVVEQHGKIEGDMGELI